MCEKKHIEFSISFILDMAPVINDDAMTSSGQFFKKIFPPNFCYISFSKSHKVTAQMNDYVKSNNKKFEAVGLLGPPSTGRVNALVGSKSNSSTALFASLCRQKVLWRRSLGSKLPTTENAFPLTWVAYCSVFLSSPCTCKK